MIGVLDCKKEGLVWELKNNAPQAAHTLRRPYRRAFVFIIGIGIIAKVAVRKKSSPLVHTLWAITTAGHPLPVSVTVAIPSPADGDHTDVQYENGKEKG